jgi:hypothetical protein
MERIQARFVDVRIPLRKVEEGKEEAALSLHLQL